MCSASIQVISESLQTTIDDIKMLRKFPSNSSEYVHPINMTAFPISIMGITIGKYFSFWLYIIPYAYEIISLCRTQIDSFLIMFS